MTAVDWSRYRACPVCGAPLGKPCVIFGGAVIVDDVISATATFAESPHSDRKLRTGYGR